MLRLKKFYEDGAIWLQIYETDKVEHVIEWDGVELSFTDISSTNHSDMILWAINNSEMFLDQIEIINRYDDCLADISITRVENENRIHGATSP